MKQKLFTLLLAVAASVGTMFAEKVKIGNLYYNLDATNRTAKVTSQNGGYPYWSTTITTANITSSVTYASVTYSVTSIGNYAFYGCSGLTSVTSPNSVTSIGNYAFNGCTGLTSIEIPHSVTSIGNYAFYGCSGLTSVTIPNSVTSIGNYAFNGCTGLTSITIPNSVTSIGNYAFGYCTGFTSIEIPNSVTSIGYGAFENCSSLTSVTIPNNITGIGGGTFENCSRLTSITIPNSVTSIGNRAFESCSALTSVTIPNSVTSIGDWAFGHCCGLTSVTIEAETPPTLGTNAFYCYTNTYPIHVPCNTASAYKSAWSNYASQIKYAPLPDKITAHAENGNVDIASLGYYTACDTELYYELTAVPNYGYHFTQWSDGLKDNPRIAQITQDTTFTAEFAYDRVGTCGKDLALTWSYDHSTKVLTIGNAGEFTENMQFGVEAPNEIEELVIGNNVTAIGENAFAGIETLKKITIGESVMTIYNNAFYNCVNLKKIFNYRQTPTNAYSTAFDGVDKFECVLYVLPNSIDMYKNAAVWRDFYYTYAIEAEETTVTTNDVTVEPQDNAATLTWPTNDNAASYTIEITKDGVVFCTLTFNTNGQLTGIAFAPSRNGSHHAPAALMTANGLQFTVTGLNSNTQYGYSVTAKDANDQTVATYSGEFTTTSEGIATGVENVQGNNVQCTKVLIDGTIFILRGEKVYNAQGALVK